MCILRYKPTRRPSASITAAVLWYSPGARRSNRGAITTNPRPPGDLSQRLRARPGHRLGEVEQRGVLHLSEIARAEPLGQTDESRALARRLLHAVDRVLQVLVLIRGHGHLHEPHLVLRRWPG